jgi:hypothetical protein
LMKSRYFVVSSVLSSLLLLSPDDAVLSVGAVA